MADPRVSIGMPVYNGARYVPEALDSLLGQTFADFELVISDNASTDGTEEVCRAYAARDPRIRYVRQPGNIGAVANFRYVLEQARGEFFMWAAHDDQWDSSFLSASTAILDCDADAGFVFPTFQLKSRALRLAVRVPSSLFAFVEDRSPDIRLLGFGNLHHGSHKCNLVYSLFRTRFLRTGLASQSIRNDGLLSMVLLSEKHGARLPEPMFSKCYRWFPPAFALHIPFLRWLLIKWARLIDPLLRDLEPRCFSTTKAEAFVAICERFPHLHTPFTRIFSRYRTRVLSTRFLIDASTRSVNGIMSDGEFTATGGEAGQDKNPMESTIRRQPTSAVWSANVTLVIGMPVYNGERFLPQALDSLLGQTFRDFELLISDNASTDATESICRSYAARDSRIRYVRQAENLGAVGNFKFVVEQARAEFFMWAAHDDQWDPFWIEAILPIAKWHACLACGTIQAINDKGEYLRTLANGRDFTYAGSRFSRRMKYYLDPPFCGKANPIYGIFPRKHIDTVLLENLDQNLLAADMRFLFAYLSSHPLHATCRVKLYKRIHSGCGGQLDEGGAISSWRRVVRQLYAYACFPWASAYVPTLYRVATRTERIAMIALYPLLAVRLLGVKAVDKAKALVERACMPCRKTQVLGDAKDMNAAGSAEG